MTDLGQINKVYRGALDADAGYGVSPAQAYAHLISKGANPNEALFLVSGAASESEFNPTAVHDNGAGYGLFGHNGSRLLAMRQFAADRGQNLSDWQTQFDFGLQELRSRPEGRAVANATTPEQLGLAQMYFERPQGFTPANPEAGHNYTGRVNQIKLFTQLNPTAAGAFSPSANPQVTPQQVAAAVPPSSAGSSDGDLRQKIADMEARWRNADSGYRQPLVSQLLGMAVQPVRDAISDGLSSLLGGGAASSASGAASPPPSAPAPLARSAPPAPAFLTRSIPSVAPLMTAAPAPAPPAPLGVPFAATGLPAPQQPSSAAIGSVASALPTFAQGGPISDLAGLLGGAVTKPSA